MSCMNDVLLTSYHSYSYNQSIYINH